ncbi:MAG: transglycosylase domain-containing protein [Acidimicrobiia bacterium]
MTDADADAPDADGRLAGRPRLRRALRVAGVVAGALALLVAGVAAWLWGSTTLPPPRSIGESAVLLDAEGRQLAVLARDGLRFEVPLEDVSPNVLDAVIASEDRRFREHTGVDPVGIARAVWNNLTDDDTEGASTITQQLVKNAYLDDDQTVERKVREAILAVKLERDQDKDRILERYLNDAYFGRGAHGIEAAARTWFDRHAADLRVDQAALLVGILPAPEALDPERRPDAARERRDAVIDAMAETGAIGRDVARTARARPVEVRPRERASNRLRAGVAPHFVEHVRGVLIDAYGERALYDRGLVVRTTLDIDEQRTAEMAVAAHLDDPGDPQAALVSIDRSGAVRAWVGGRNFELLRVDLVSHAGGSGRQPGSTFKPITLAAHLEDGGRTSDPFPAPARIELPLGERTWEVSNAGGAGYGTLTIAEATVRSVNTVHAQAVLGVGPREVADLAERLGIERDLEARPPIGLGAEEVSPLELANAYATLARGGVRIDPRAVQRVETRRGAVLHDAGDPEGERVLEAWVADTVNAVLQQVPRSGTARAAALDRPMAAKTGTTQGNADGWLAGYTPERTTVVWVGDAYRAIPVEVDGRPVQGGTVPARIWHDFMVAAMADVPPTPFPEPGRPPRSAPDAGADEVAEPAPTTTADAPGAADPAPEPEPEPERETRPPATEPPPPTTQGRSEPPSSSPPPPERSTTTTTSPGIVGEVLDPGA